MAVKTTSFQKVEIKYKSLSINVNPIVRFEIYLYMKKKEVKTKKPIKTAKGKKVNIPEGTASFQDVVKKLFQVKPSNK